MSAFISTPRKIPFYLKLGIFIAEKLTGKQMLPARILSWFPKAAVGSGLLESLTVHGKNGEEKRILRLVRLKAAFTAACPFCVDMNAFELEKHNVSEKEFRALQTNFSEDFSIREKLAIEYARLISSTPLIFPTDFIEKLKKEFTEREIVMIATAAAQVNYWARLIQSLGIPPAGFSENCRL